MFRVTFMSKRFLAVRINSVSMDAENIQIFASEGTPVIIVDELEDLDRMGIDHEDVELVE